jgi:hypothetical protein
VNGFPILWRGYYKPIYAADLEPDFAFLPDHRRILGKEAMAELTLYAIGANHATAHHPSVVSMCLFHIASELCTVNLPDLH